MIEFNFDLITGVMFGIEFPSLPEEDIKWAVVVDLAIFRLSLISWKQQEL